MTSYKFFDNLYLKQDPWRIKESKAEEKRSRVVAEYLKKVTLDENSLVLDIGGGEGTIAEWIFNNTKLNIINLDVSFNALKRAKNSIYKFLIQGDCRKLPFKNGMFDVVLALEVLYYLEDYNQGLSEIHRVLKNNGYVIISVALGKNYLNWLDFVKDCNKYFRILRTNVLKFKLWFIKRKHIGHGILIGKKVIT